jgi:hypothetical protein
MLAFWTPLNSCDVGGKPRGLFGALLFGPGGRYCGFIILLKPNNLKHKRIFVVNTLSKKTLGYLCHGIIAIWATTCYHDVVTLT